MTMRARELTSRDREGAVFPHPLAYARGSYAHGWHARGFAVRSCARAFSLIEVLLAIFILGVGVISIAALFPAGIAQQRASVDETLGSTIADNALSLLRTKLKSEDFGTFEEFGINPPRVTIRGDFPWIKPGFLFMNDPFGATPNLDERGAIDIFCSFGAPVAGTSASPVAGAFPGPSAQPLYGIPFSSSLYPTGAPRIIISQTERYYPAVSQNGSADVPKPQYVWDCMFRRFQGKILVAIFVYRVTQPGGGTTQYAVAPDVGNATLSPLPIWLDLTLPATQAYSCADGPWHPGGPDGNLATVYDDASTAGIDESNAIILGVPDGVLFNPDDQQQSWQEPRQWILDQNNNMHRVLGVTREDWNANTGDVAVELVRAAPAYALNPAPAFGPAVKAYFIDAGPNPDVVSDIWYIPGTARDVDGNLLTLTPVFATVKEL